MFSFVLQTPKNRSATTATPVKKTPSTIPKPDSDKLFQKSLQSFQTSLGSRRSAVKGFFTNDRDRDRDRDASATPSASTTLTFAPSSSSSSPVVTPETKRSRVLSVQGEGYTSGSSSPNLGKIPEEAVNFFNEDMIQQSFLNCFSSILLNYRKYLKPPTEEEWNGSAKLELFKGKEFLSQLEGERRVMIALQIFYSAGPLNPFLFFPFTNPGIYDPPAGHTGFLAVRAGAHPS